MHPYYPTFFSPNGDRKSTMLSRPHQHHHHHHHHSHYSHHHQHHYHSVHLVIFAWFCVTNLAFSGIARAANTAANRGTSTPPVSVQKSSPDFDRRSIASPAGPAAAVAPGPETEKTIFGEKLDNNSNDRYIHDDDEADEDEDEEEEEEEAGEEGNNGKLLKNNNYNNKNATNDTIDSDADEDAEADAAYLADDDDDRAEHERQKRTNRKSAKLKNVASESVRVSVTGNENVRNNESDESVIVDDTDIDEDDFCWENYVDSAYYNGYDTIMTRGDRLWYYYKDQHRISKAYDQRRFTQGDHIQGAFNVSQAPSCSKSSESVNLVFSRLNSTAAAAADATLASFASSQQSSQSSYLSPSSASLKSSSDCGEISKMRGMAVYFLHNKDRSRSYYNLDVRNRNGTQKRVRSRDLPWGMKQVGLLGGNLWPNGWEAYQQYRPVAFLPSRYELIFIINHHHNHHHHPEHYNLERNVTTSASSPDSSSSNRSTDTEQSIGSTALLTWNSLDSTAWNSSWRSRLLTHAHPVVFTGMFEMNGIVYAIGESRRSTPQGKTKRVGKIYRYYVTKDDGRDLRETDQSVRDFFGCPRRWQDDPASMMQSTSSTSATTTTTTTTTTTSTTSTTSTSTTTETPETTNLPEINEDDVDRNETNEDATDNDENDDFVSPNLITARQAPNLDQISDKTVIMPDDSQIKTANVFLANSPPQTTDQQSANQIFTSVFLQNSKAKILPVNGSSSSSATTTTTTTTTNKHFLSPTFTSPGVTLRESDSILLTIFIGIVISACIATIILAFLTITGRKKVPPRFEGARIERTIPKPTIIGLDYHPRKNSSESTTHINLMNRYDSMNSLNAIYSQIGRPLMNGSAVSVRSGGPLHQTKNFLAKPLQKSKHHHHHHHQQQQQQMSNIYNPIDRINTSGYNGGLGDNVGVMTPTATSDGPASPHQSTYAKSNNSSSPHDAFSGHHHVATSGGAAFPHFDAFD